MKPPDEKEAAELGKRMRRRHAADFSLFQLERTCVRAPNRNEKARRGTGVRCFFQLFFLDSSVTREMIEASFMPGVAYRQIRAAQSYYSATGGAWSCGISCLAINMPR